MIRYDWNPEKKDHWDIHGYPWTDSQGNEWRVYVNLKRIAGRIVPSKFQLISVGNQALSHQTLVEVPLREITQDFIERETELVDKKFKKVDLAPHHGRAHTEQELKAIADIYIKAWELRIPVQRAVAEALDIPVSTAVKRIIAARKQGLIPKSINSKK